MTRNDECRLGSKEPSENRITFSTSTHGLFICWISRGGRLNVNLKLSEWNAAFPFDTKSKVVVFHLLVLAERAQHHPFTGSFSRLGYSPVTQYQNVAKAQPNISPKPKKKLHQHYRTTLKVDPGFEPGLTEVLKSSKSAVILYRDQRCAQQGWQIS